MGVVDYGTSSDPQNAPSLASWAAAVAAVLNNSDDTVDDRITAALAAYTPGGGSPSRATATATSTSIAPGATWTGTITLAKSYLLMRLQTSVAARVRLYSTTAGQTADLSRDQFTAPDDSVGCMLDYITTAATLTSGLSPLVVGTSLEGTPSSSIPITITNLSGSTATVTATLTWLQTEE